MAERNQRSKGPTKPLIVRQIMDAYPFYKSEYLFWRFCPEAVVSEIRPGCSFEELKKGCGMPDAFTEASCGLWLLDENVQGLVRQLLKAKNGEQLLELHQLYFEKAKEDPRCLTGLMQLNDVLFKNNESELISLLEGIPDSIGKGENTDV